MVDRIKQIMEMKGLTPAVFADLLEINRSSLTHLFSGRNQPSLDLSRKILKVFPDVKTEWLIMGVGPMLQDEVRAVVNAQVGAAPDLLSTDERVSVPAPSTDLFSVADPSPAPLLVASPQSSESLPEVLPVPELLSSPKEEPQQPAQPEPLPEVPQPKPTTPNRERTASARSRNAEKNDSQSVKTVEKIVFFYSNKTFEVFFPEK